MQVKRCPNLDAPLADICLGSSTASTYLPAHYFETPDELGNMQQCNLIDGVAANNPVINMITT